MGDCKGIILQIVPSPRLVMAPVETVSRVQGQGSMNGKNTKPITSSHLHRRGLSFPLPQESSAHANEELSVEMPLAFLPEDCMLPLRAADWPV